MQIKINCPCAFSETGKRANNEDCIFPDKGQATEFSKFFVVCDGMGGYEGGEIASNVVCKSFASFLSGNKKFNADVFQNALNYAYDELDKQGDKDVIDKKTGTTLTFLYLYEQGALMAHIGDSRIYHLRKNGSQMEILYKSEDHSFVNELLKAGMITPQEAETHPKKNIITRAIQPHQEKRNKAEIRETKDVKAGDYFFLCTDGVLESINDEKLTAILSAGKSLEEKTNAIVRECRNNSRDNFSAYLVAVEDARLTNEDNTVSGTFQKKTVRKPPFLRYFFYSSAIVSCICVLAYFLLLPPRTDEKEIKKPEIKTDPIEIPERGLPQNRKEDEALSIEPISPVINNITPASVNDRRVPRDSSERTPPVITKPASPEETIDATHKPTETSEPVQEPNAVIEPSGQEKGNTKESNDVVRDATEDTIR